MSCTCLRKLVDPKHVCQWHAWKAAKHARATATRHVRNVMRHLRRRLAAGREAVVYIETRQKVLAGRGYMQPMGAKT
jgi:hypothetical protein